MTLRWRLFPKYATLIIALVGGMLVASGGISLYFSYRENQEHLVALQREKAEAAATRIEQYILDIEQQLGWTALPQVGAGGNPLDQRRFEYLKLLRQVPAITEVAWIDASGRERLKVSRLAMDVSGADIDLSQDPRFTEAKSGKTWYSPVYFRKETEPYMTISRPAGSGGGVTIAEVNLKFVWEVVSRIKVGQAGLAFVVNSAGTLIAHPDISLVLQKTDLTKLAQVATLAQGAEDDSTAPSIARDLKGVEVLTAHARIPTLNWTVFVELPLAEAFKPVYESIQRMGLLLLAGLAVSMLASFFLARLMVRPIRALQEGAAQIGAGKLEQKIEVHSGDELESLADQFNDMTARLRESYSGLERKVEQRTEELTHALEQQTATAEILRVISGSFTDTKPVFEAIVKSGARLFDGWIVVLALVNDGQIVGVAWSSVPRGHDPSEAMFTIPLSREYIMGQAILERRVIAIPDLAAPGVPETGSKFGQGRGVRALLVSPMLREGVAIGVVVVTREDPGHFTDKQIALVKTFADQAVIAIQNVRLFNETKEALEKQTAIAEILRVISSSPTDTQPVFDAIVYSCQRLFQGRAVGFLQPRGEMLENVAFADDGTVGDTKAGFLKPWPLDRSSASGACILDARVVNVGDTVEASNEFPRMKDLARALGYHSALFVPLLRDGRAAGAIAILRATTGAFTEQQVALAKTFADQAMIAIENVRLFNETKEALERQTATAEILKVISSSPTDLTPVFDAILENALRLCDAHLGLLGLYDGKTYKTVAHRGGNLEFAKWIMDRGPFDPLQNMGSIGRMVSERQPIHHPDYTVSRGYLERQNNSVNMVELGGVRTYLAVPMLKEGRVIGGITIYRPEVRPFTQKQIDLLSTFANQAVIAIENVRLFHEIQETSRQLEIAGKHKSEFLANMSHELRTPLNAIIGFSEVLLEKMFGEMNEKQEDYLKDIHSSGKHLLSLINDILDLAKVEAGRMELNLATFDLPTAIDNALTLIRERAMRHSIALAAEVDPQLGELNADERKVKQILLNLLSNAVKFTPEGGSITVGAHRIGDMIEIAVTDTGIGIAPEDQAAVFEEFKQVGTDYTRKAEGTGLGLALTRRLVELHGGAMRLESEPGKGSTFTFTLPLIPAAPDAASA